MCYGKGMLMKRILNCLLKSMLVLGVTALAEQDLTTNDGTGTGALIRQARYLVNLALPGGDSVYLQPGESGLYDYSRARGNQSRWYVMNDGATAGAIAVTYADPGYGSGTYSPPPDYFGYKFKYPVTITQLTYVDYCFGDGGTFSSAPELQVLSSLAGTWTTVTSSITPAYQNWFSSGRRVTYTITPEHLITDAWGVRLYGNTTASRAWDQNGWVGVTELRVSGTPAFGLALDFTVNIALSGTPFCSNNAWKAGDGKEINDGNFDNHTELWDAAAPAGDKQVGISWSAPQRDVAALGVAMTFFIDGGWYHDTPADPLQVEYTSDGVNWSAVTGLKKGRYTADYAVCAALPWEYKGTWLFTFDPVDNVRGIRLSGLPAGDVAALGGHGYISLREMEVYAAFPVPPECLAGSYLKPTNTTAGSRLGFSVAVNGDTAIVGAPLEDGVAADSGAAYIFVKTNGVWSQQAYLKAGTIGWGHLFGYSVDISGETAIVGVPMENGNAYQSGAAYVFVREDGVWSQQAYLKAKNTGVDDRIGVSVATDGKTIIAGADFEDGGATEVDGLDNDALDNAGAAYTFDLLEWEPGLSILSAVVTSGGRWGDFNFAQGKTVTPHSNVKSGNPQYVVDANYGTSWYSYQGNGNQISFTLDLGCEITIGCFVHYPLQTEFYQIESSSDGSNWSSRVSAAIPAVPAAAFTNDVSGAYSARYIRYTGKTTQVAWVGVAEFEVYGVASAAENMILSFRSLPQRLYTLQQCNDLQVGIWTDVPGQTRVPGTGGRLALQHQRTAPAQFYRLKESETQ